LAYPDVKKHAAEHSALRFAVGTFDTWGGVQEALRQLHARGIASDAFNCLGLHDTFASKPEAVFPDKVEGTREFAFSDGSRLISCTSGTMAQCLAARLAKGAPSLDAALGHWLIPRHAAELQRAVEDGKIVLWVQLFDANDERRAYQTLLAHSSDSVGVHDLSRD
jgi:hypothetical protein